MALSDVGILTDDELQKIYVWVDSIPLSRPKRNIARDFSDGVLTAEIAHHYFPKYVELHNYSSANSIRQKLYNWSTLNQKVFKRLDFEVKKADVEAIVNCKPGVIELILMQLQRQITDVRARRAAGELSPPHGTDEAPAFRELAAGAAAPSLGAAPTARALQMGGVGAATSRAAAAAGGAGASTVDAAVLAEKDAVIAELRETIEIQEMKIRKLEQLVRLKDQRIQTITARLQTVPGAGPA